MKLATLIKELYANPTKSKNYTKSITLSNSLAYLTAVSDNFSEKAKSKRTSPLERKLYAALVDDLITILQSYNELLSDLLGAELSVDMGAYYKIRLSDGFDQVIYKPNMDKSFLKIGSWDLLEILNTIYVKLSDKTVDMVIRDNKNYKTLVNWLNDLVNNFETGLDRIQELTPETA